MKAVILNNHFEKPEDGFYKILSAGRHGDLLPEATVVVDALAMRSIVHRFNEENYQCENIGPSEVSAAGENNPLGWITRMEQRESGIYARVQWRADNWGLIQNSDYKFFDVQFDLDVKNVLSDGGKRTIRPLRISKVGVTNDPLPTRVTHELINS